MIPTKSFDNYLLIGGNTNKGNVIFPLTILLQLLNESKEAILLSSTIILIKKMTVIVIAIAKYLSFFS